MSDGGEVVVDSELGALLLEEGAVKLFPVVRRNHPWDAKPTEKVLPYELPCGLFGDCGNGFGLDPLGEVIDGYEQKFLPTLGLWKGTQDINAPSGERARLEQTVKLFGWLLDEYSELLAFWTFPDEGHAILLKRRPPEPCSDDAAC